jgi:DNA mismatch repair ATPase MutL
MISWIRSATSAFALTQKGEGLFGLASACEVLEVVSKTEDKELACKLDSIKRVITETAFPNAKGTRVVLRNLFAGNEIRKAQLKSNLEGQLSLCRALIFHYGVIYHDIEFRLFMIDGKGKSKSIFSKAKFDDPISNLSAVFDSGIGRTFQPFEAEDEEIKVKGYLSNPFQTETTVINNHIFVAVNRRPVRELKSIRKLMRSLFEKKTGSREGLAVLYIECPMANVEVNIEKSKMNVRFKNESKIAQLITQSIEQLLDELYSNSIKKIPAPIPKTTVMFESQVITRPTNDTNNSDAKKEARIYEETPQRLTPFEGINGLKVQNLTKKNLSDLIVIGQFNKGFIICKLKGNEEHLFVVDQHAADEKAVYERLLDQAKLDKQVLGCPMRIKLTSFEVLLVEKHTDVFCQFGFDVRLILDEDSAEVLSFPRYQDSQYGLDEFYELLNILKSNDPLDNFHFKKLQTRLASNACRYSIMIGQVLTDEQMLSIIRNLATLKAPFNCPHGRPTLFQTSNALNKSPQMNQINDILFHSNS